MRQHRFTGPALVLMAACANPTAPQPTGCTFVTHVPAKGNFPAFRIKVCVPSCDEADAAWAKANNQELVREWLCARRAA